MPELPEVHTFKVYFDATALQQKILQVEVQDDKIIRNMDGSVFEEKLKGLTFTDSYRHGKYLFGLLDNGHSVLLHFGMTGDLVYYHNEEDQPRHERFAFQFGAGRLGFDCPRKFARILYLEDFNQYLEDQKLGPDALEIDQKTFLKATEGKKTTLKGFLLNQANLAGVGNLYADEICYQAKLHPASRVNHLSTKQLKKVFQLVKSILQEAVDRRPHYKQYPEDWFWNWRKEGAPGPSGKGVIEKTKVAGRTTYFCTPIQKLIVSP